MVGTRIKDKRGRFIGIFGNVPETLRDDIIVTLDKKPYTWNTAFLEIKDNTSLGKKLLKRLEELDIL
ncbi:MAG TPA: hypothetical protein VJB08_06095 [Candidatus Nanoarchaeia archaeon]|nr:hypothetical protein [Candidatus Nanoarchaeia archaeon]